jgi:ABC-type hemin transport system ATPase subunit
VPRARFVRSVEVERSPRVVQLEGMFDMPVSRVSTETWELDLPLDERPWQVGLVVGPSGSGKSTLLQEVFGSTGETAPWPERCAVIDGFEERFSVKEVVAALSAVGFSAPPNWLRPYQVLSNGERFRVELARALIAPGRVALG